MKPLASDTASAYLSPLRIGQGDERPTKRSRNAFNWVLRNEAIVLRLSIFLRNRGAADNIFL